MISKENMPQKNKTRSYKSIVIRIVGIVSCFAILLYFFDIKSAFNSLIAMPIWIIGVSFFLVFIRAFFLSIRWRILASSDFGITQLEFFKVTLVGGVASVFLPGLISGDIIKMAIVHKRVESQKTKAAVSIVVDRFIGFLSILLLGILVFSFSPKFDNRLFIILSLVLMSLAMILVGYLSSVKRLQIFVINNANKLGIIGQKFSKILTVIFDAMGHYSDKKKRLWLALLMSIPCHLLWFFLVYIAALTLGIDTTFWVVSATTVVIWVAMMVPISLGGIGLRELGFVYLLSVQGVTESDAVALGLFQSAIIVLTSLLSVPVLFTLTKRGAADPD